MSCELVTGWVSFYCALVTVLRPELEPWTHLHLIWVSQIRFSQLAQESTRLDYLHEVEHMRGTGSLRLEQAIVEAVKLASPALQEVIQDSGKGIARHRANLGSDDGAAEASVRSLAWKVTRQLMGYCGVVPSEDSGGNQTQRGGSITKDGKRAPGDGSSSKQHGVIIVILPSGLGCNKRQQSVSEEAKEIAWKAQHRLHKRYARLAAKGKDKRKIVTAVGRELLGFIWAIGTRAETTARQRIAA